MIEPGQIPRIEGNLDALASHGRSLRSAGASFATTGSDVNASWQGLSAFYSAPEAATLLTALVPVKSRAEVVAADLRAVGAALVDYADTVRPLQHRLELLHDAADSFRSRSDAAESNRILAETNSAVAAWMAAERTCANAIIARFNGLRYVQDNGDATADPNEFGYSAEQLDAASSLPWGSAEERDKPAWLDVLDAVASFGRGFGQDGAWGDLKGLGNLIGIGGGDAFKQSWTGIAELGLAATPNASMLISMNQVTALPGLEKGQLARDYQNMGKGLLAWDEWKKDPARALGNVTWNVVSLVFGSKGTSAVLKTAKVAEFTDKLSVTVGRVTAKLPSVRLSTDLAHVDNLEFPAAPRSIDGLHPAGAHPELSGSPAPSHVGSIPDRPASADGLNTSHAELHDPVPSDGPAASHADQASVPARPAPSDSVLHPEPPPPQDPVSPAATHADRTLPAHPDGLHGPAAAHAEPPPPPGRSLSPHGAEVPSEELKIDPAGDRELATVGAGSHTSAGAPDLSTPDHPFLHDVSDISAPHRAGDIADAHRTAPPSDHALGTHHDSVGGDHSLRAGESTQPPPSFDQAAHAHGGDTAGPPLDPSPHASNRAMPGLIRRDDDFSADVNPDGYRKSHLDEEGNLTPANVDGDLEPYQHVLGFRNPMAKSNSPFSSATWEGGSATAKNFGRYEIRIDLDRLHADVSSGRLRGVRIYNEAEVQQSLQDEIDRVAGRHVEVTLHTPSPTRVEEFARSLGLSKNKTKDIVPRITGLLNTRRDQEWLIRGIVPHEYIRGPYPTRGR